MCYPCPPPPPPPRAREAVAPRARDTRPPRPAVRVDVLRLRVERGGDIRHVRERVRRLREREAEHRPVVRERPERERGLHHGAHAVEPSFAREVEADHLLHVLAQEDRRSVAPLLLPQREHRRHNRPPLRAHEGVGGVEPAPDLGEPPLLPLILSGKLLGTDDLELGVVRPRRRGDLPGRPCDR
eukprot:gene11783-biopygen8556